MILDEKDFLTFQLYNASKTPRIRNTRIRNWILFVFLMFCLAYLFSDRDDNFLKYYFLSMGVTGVFIYPLYSRWWHRRHYTKFVHDTYNDRIGLDSTLTFTPDTIQCKDRTGEMFIYKSEIEAIDVIPGYYFLKIKGGGTMILPKAKVDKLEEVEHEIRTLLDRGDIKHTIDLKWKWR